jgi:hypothetical protein
MWIKETDNDNSIFKNIEFSNIRRRRMSCYSLWHLKVQCIRQNLIFTQNESKIQLTALWTVANLVVELCQCISNTSWRWTRSGRKDPRIFILSLDRRQVVSRFTSDNINLFPWDGELSRYSCMDRNPFPKSNLDRSARSQ